MQTCSPRGCVHATCIPQTSISRPRRKPGSISCRAAQQQPLPWWNEHLQAEVPQNPDVELINEGKATTCAWHACKFSSRHLASPLGVLLLPDFRPVLDSERTFGLVDIASLWIGLVVSLTTYFLAGSMVADMGELQRAPRSSCLCCNWWRQHLTWGMLQKAPLGQSH